jgi:acyl-CoA dehydrogenase
MTDEPVGHPVDPDLVDLVTSVFTDHRARQGHARRVNGRVVFDRALWDTLESLGLTRLTVDESTGGAGAGWPEAAALLGAAAFAGVPVPLVEHDLLAAWLLEEAGTAAVPRIGTAAVPRVRTAAIFDTRGTANEVAWAEQVDEIVALWQESGRWFVAEASMASASVEPGSNIAGEPRDTVKLDLGGLDAVPVPASLAGRLFVRGALARTIQTCAALERIVGLCVEHTRSRVQFGRSLNRFQAVQQLVADVAAETALARAATDLAVNTAAEDADAETLAFAVAVAKSCAGHATSVVVRNAHQVHGAIGTADEHLLPEFTGSALAWRSEFGGVSYWDRLLTRTALSVGSDGIWPMMVEGGRLAGIG